MIFTENADTKRNADIIRARFPGVWQLLKEFGELPAAGGQFSVTAAKNGQPTLSLEKEGKTYYLHSAYNPEEEAGRLASRALEEAGEAHRYKHLFFYGVGLGYQIEAFTRSFPGLPFTVYEPHPEVFRHYLATRPLSVLPLHELEGLHVGYEPAATTRFLAEYAARLQGETLFIALPAYERLFPEEFQEFTAIFREVLAGTRNLMRTTYAYEKKWTYNSLVNIQQLLKTPNVLDKTVREYFHGKPALIVAAGPSVHEELENIRYIKENGLAYIFSVGSGINPLLNAGIHPDAACTYDPKKNIFVFKKVIEEKITTIPLVFGSSVGPDIFPDYPGPMLHMVMDQDTVANFFLRFATGEEPEIIQDAPTIAIVTLQLLAKLGAEPVIFAGQNLAYKDGLVYAEGIPYYNPKLTEKKQKAAFLVEDVYGGQVYTSEGLNLMRLNMEHMISLYPGREFINTTKGGAKIKGAPFQPLEQVIKERLTARVVAKDWWVRAAETATPYDRGYLRRQVARMNGELVDMKGVLREFEENFRLLAELAPGKDTRLEQVFLKFDRDLKKLIKNQFYQVFLKPVMRVELELLGRKNRAIRFAPDPVVKARMIKEEYGRVIEGFQRELSTLEPLYDRQLRAVSAGLE
jgi:hypothetical protein